MRTVKNKKLNVLVSAVAAALCTAALPGTTLAASPEQARSVTYEMDIPPQDLHAALQQLALVSNHKLFYRSELVSGKSSPAVKGNFTAEQAIQMLLAGTDLTFEITAGDVVLIRGKDEESSAENWRDRVEEIIVTAQKKAQSLQEVPMSVTAIGERSIEQIGRAHV